MRFRIATQEDAQAIAALHALSWREHYRGAFLDSYLDGPVFADRRDVWDKRLSDVPENQYVVLAEENDELIGFACVYGDDDETWGSLLDNIHVLPEQQSGGIGAQLFAEVCAWCRTHFPDCGLYLWVLVDNVRAQAFYKRHGATDQGGELSEPPGGGEIHGRRYVWKTLPALE